MIITVTEFVKLYKDSKVQNTKINPDAVEKFVREKLEIKEYLPFVNKRELCEKVLNASCKKNGAIIEVDSVSRYILFTITMLSTYTNLEFENNDDEDAIDQYDLLCQSGLLNEILNVIGGEYEVCNNILNMMMADIDANNNNVAAVFDKSLQKVLGSVDRLIDSLADKVEDMNFDLSQLDIDKYKGLLDLLTNK